MPAPHGLGPRGFLTEEEKEHIPKITKGLLKRILSYLKPYKLQFFLVFVTAVVCCQFLTPPRIPLILNFCGSGESCMR